MKTADTTLSVSAERYNPTAYLAFLIASFSIIKARSSARSSSFDQSPGCVWHVYQRVHCARVAANYGGTCDRVCVCINSLTPCGVTLHPALCLHACFRTTGLSLLVLICLLCSVLTPPPALLH
jgi:hypothetical protein